MSEKIQSEKPQPPKIVDGVIEVQTPEKDDSDMMYLDIKKARAQKLREQREKYH